jgi:hypothetical protein
MSVGAAPVAADLLHFLLPGFLAFDEIFVISFRLLNNAFTLLIRPVFTGGAGCLLVPNNVFTLLIGPVFTGGAGCLLFLNIADFLFHWLVAGALICLYVRIDETFTSRMSRCANLPITIVVLRSRTDVLGVPCGACRREGDLTSSAVRFMRRRWTVHMAPHHHSCQTRNYVAKSREPRSTRGHGGYEAI